MTDKQKPTVVLLVEDEVLVRMLADEVLTELGGFRVIATSNADEAVSILYVRTDVRVLLTDVDMPGSMDGVALAHAVHGRWPEVAIIVTSGVGVTAPLPHGARFIRKPYRPAELIELIRGMLDASGGPTGIDRSEPANDKAPAAAVLPNPVNLGGLRMGNGTTGGLAQPLPEPEE